MKYYKIAEEDLKDLISKVLDNGVEDEYHNAEFVTKTGTDKAMLLITGHHGTTSRAYEFEEIKAGLKLQEITDKFNKVNRIIADLSGDITDKARLELEDELLELKDEIVVFLKPPAIDIDKLEGAVWHGCPKTHAHTEFSELKFKGDSMFISGFCLHCEDEMVRLSEKKDE